MRKSVHEKWERSGKVALLCLKAHGLSDHPPLSDHSIYRALPSKPSYRTTHRQAVLSDQSSLDERGGGRLSDQKVFGFRFAFPPSVFDTIGEASEPNKRERDDENAYRTSDSGCGSGCGWRLAVEDGSRYSSGTEFSSTVVGR